MPPDMRENAYCTNILIEIAYALARPEALETLIVKQLYNYLQNNLRPIENPIRCIQRKPDYNWEQVWININNETEGCLVYFSA